MENSSQLTKKRYDRIAPVYDIFETGMELFWSRWRPRLFAMLGPGKVLEVGVGTGKNLAFYGPEHQVVGIDLSEKMLAVARQKAGRENLSVVLECGDVQSLDFEDASFDFVCCTCVFCSVPDPVLGLGELKRVLKPEGSLLMLEHVISRKRWIAALMKVFDWIPFHVWGAHINRDTIVNLEKAGFHIVREENLFLDVVKLLMCKG